MTSIGASDEVLRGAFSKWDIIHSKKGDENYRENYTRKNKEMNQRQWDRKILGKSFWEISIWKRGTIWKRKHGGFI